jgi:hypothetical protein
MLNVQCSTSTYSEKIEKIEKTILCGQRSENGEKKSIFSLTFAKKQRQKSHVYAPLNITLKKYCSDFRFTFYSQNVLQKEMKM